MAKKTKRAIDDETPTLEEFEEAIESLNNEVDSAYAQLRRAKDEADDAYVGLKIAMRTLVAVKHVVDAGIVALRSHVRPADLDD